MELVVKSTDKKRTLIEGDVKEVHKLQMVGVSADGRLTMTVSITSEDKAAISRHVPMIEGAKRSIKFKKVNQTLDGFVENGPMTQDQSGETLSDEDQSAYDAKLKEALDITKPALKQKDA